MQVLPTSEVPSSLMPRIRQLLDEAFGGEFSDDDWEHCLGGWHVLITDDGLPLAHAAVVPRVLEIGGVRWRCGYVEGVATRPRSQGQGLGSSVMQRLGMLVRAEFGIGALSTCAHGFYARHGWERWQGPTYVRRGSRLVRTEDEDAGIMVLRFGPSLRVSLTESISCDERAGDDW
jgi:aminoglycoside 2'-N-acetyltransferase I